MRKAALLAAILALSLVAVPTVTARQWADPDEADIQPGVQIKIDGHGWCTSNFVFTNAGDDDVYLGTAGHCPERDVGADVHLPDDLGFYQNDPGPKIGEVVYSSWAIENVHLEDCFVVFSCSTGPGNDANDFALIRIDEAWEDDVSPSMKGFGGPTGMADTSNVETGDRILTYGNSPLRPADGPEDHHAGVVTRKDAWTVRGYTATPGVPGDSGSGAMLSDGKAVGVVVTLAVAPPGENGMTRLDRAVDFANDNGWNLQLATAPLQIPPT